MATAPDLAMIEEETPTLAEVLDLGQILSGQNLAELITKSKLNEIGQRVIGDVELDEGSRAGWLTRYERNIDIAMQVKKAKNTPWVGAANAISPILTVSSIQFNAEAYPIIVDGSNLVKGRVLGPDPDGQKRGRADRIAQHMTWQLLYRMPGWEESTDALLLQLPIVGCMFRKAYYDPIENANRCEIVTGKDFIIDYMAKSIETAPRYTQVLHYYPYEVAEFIVAGQWLDIPLDDTEQDSDDDQALGDYYEQHRTLDLDGDGYPEHYVVTCTKEGEIARIVPCFGPENVTVLINGETVRLSEVLEVAEQNQAPEILEMVERIVKIERRQYFVKYGFIPAPDGSFYDIGFGDLIENTTGLINTLQNQMLDAATLANAQGGFLGSGANVRGGNFTFRTVGEWKRVDITGGTLRDNILPLSLPGPSAVSFSLLELLMQSAKDITSSQDVVAGRAPPNQPATTTLALIEQAGTVRKGIFKRIHRAFGQELRILRRLNRDYLDEEEYFQLNDAEEAVKIGREDYADDDLDVIPVSDPSQISDMHKMARAEAIMQTFNGDPLINQRLIRQNMLEAMGARDIKAYFEVPEPPPPPEMLKIMADAEAKKADSETKRITARAGAAKNLMSAGKDALEMGLVEDAAALAAGAIDETIEEPQDEPADEPGGLPGMEGQPDDASLSGLPQGAPDGLGEPMGEGPAGFAPPGATGPGSFAGPSGEPPV